jgi:hypothetical protein
MWAPVCLLPLWDYWFFVWAFVLRLYVYRGVCARAGVAFSAQF